MIVSPGAASGIGTNGRAHRHESAARPRAAPATSGRSSGACPADAHRTPGPQSRLPIRLDAGRTGGCGLR